MAERTEISSLGEFGLIDRITAGFNQHHASSLKGIGDDAAVLKNGDVVKVITTDILVEGIHFDLSYCPLKHLGYKAVVVNLSDVYAMNAIPQQILVSIAISNRFSVEAVDEIFKGIKLACDRYKVDLIGGDTTASNKGLIINVMAIGQVEESEITYRSGAKEGDLICVSGDLGGAYLGLQLLEREKQIRLENQEIPVDFEDKKYLLERQLKPEARREITEYLRENKIIPTAMIDISDGLSSEILHLCKASKVGCVIEEREIPIHEESLETALKFKLDPTMCALSGGEDYELLFTIDPKHRAFIDKGWDVKVIGTIVDENLGAKLHTQSDNFYDIISLGWNSLRD